MRNPLRRRAALLSTPGDASQAPDEAGGLTTPPASTLPDEPTKPIPGASSHEDTGARASGTPAASGPDGPETSGASSAPRDIARIARADRFRLRDLLTEAMNSIGGRTGRLILTILGTVLGIAALVVTIGLAQTAAGQINKTFDAVAATQVVVKPASQMTSMGTERATGRLPWDADERIMRINGVLWAGTVSDVNIGQDTVTAVPVNDPSQPVTFSPKVLAVSPGFLQAVRGEIRSGRFFDSGFDTRADKVVVLGANAAERLGINRVETQPSIFIGEHAYAVIGIIDNVARRIDVMDAVLIPNGTARQDFSLPAPQELQVQIEVGAGPVVAEQAPVIMDPENPDTIKVQAPPVLTGVRESIQADINSIFLALGAVALLVGGIGIANVTLLGVMERVGEIGLRRALGATRRNIAAQFVVESAIIGLLGGLIGAAIGVIVVVTVSMVQEWTPILDTLMVAGAALLGGLIGLAAGIYPALKAASVEPISALRGAA